MINTALILLSLLPEWSVLTGMVLLTERQTHLN